MSVRSGQLLMQSARVSELQAQMSQSEHCLQAQAARAEELEREHERLKKAFAKLAGKSLDENSSCTVSVFIMRNIFL